MSCPDTQPDQPGEDRNFRRCGFVALVGAPNAGKSTLLNALVGEKISIVTPKVQTTRTRVTGIVIEGESQIIFIDTPGIFVPRHRLERAMVDSAWSGVADADASVLLVDARRPPGTEDDDTARIVDGLRQRGGTAILALNKVDLVPRERLLAASARLNADGLFAHTFMISALTGDGVADLRRCLATVVPSGPWHYPADQIAEIPLRMLAAEVTREKLFLALHQEVPYRITVETENWTESAKGGVRIDQVVYVERDSHKKIVLGKAGQQIKAIGTAARTELAAYLDRPVHLFLHVKVREGWLDDPARYREMGLDFPE
jgi:GTP-binding protein Era